VTSGGMQPFLHVPVRAIPLPAHLSAEAQAVLGMGRMEGPPYPAPDDIDGWRAMIAAQDAMVVQMTAEQASRIAAEVKHIEVDGIAVYVITPHSAEEDDPRVYLEIHGGGLIAGAGDACRAIGMMAAARNGICTWAVDYRMPPEHPYPTPLDDCLTVYRALLRNHRPQDVIVAGSSAGANLAAALILRARDEGLPLPAAAVLLTPEHRGGTAPRLPVQRARRCRPWARSSSLRRLRDGTEGGLTGPASPAAAGGARVRTRNRYR
jgi:monoterpene epsilon-lactone hydrolase